MDSSRLGAWLRQQREARCWARSEMARRLIRAAYTIGDRSITGIDNLCHNIYRWERGKVTPGERYKLYYCQAFGIPVSEYGVGRAGSEVSNDDLAMMALDLLASVLGLRRHFTGQKLIVWSGQENHETSLACIPADLLPFTAIVNRSTLTLVAGLTTVIRAFAYALIIALPAGSGSTHRVMRSFRRTAVATG